MASFGAGYVLGRMTAGADAEASRQMQGLARRLSQLVAGPRQAIDAVPQGYVVSLEEHLAVVAERDRYRALYHEGCAAYITLRDHYEKACEAYVELRDRCEKDREDYAKLWDQYQKRLIEDCAALFPTA